jgi:hypothetical protein
VCGVVGTRTGNDGSEKPSFQSNMAVGRAQEEAAPKSSHDAKIGLRLYGALQIWVFVCGGDFGCDPKPNSSPLCGAHEFLS